MCRCTPEIRTPWCGKIGCEIPMMANEPKSDSLDQHEERIFDILNCFEVDARNITNGHTFIDSQEARKLARAIIHSIKENS